ncbi:helix-turn-helix domain-containing protein [Streptomyces decoyicus]|uniref:winged helix-turn-helix domain-containing protein n=1 Tax=Streptomyces decoyicus TaxID=249567 RepID=UPI003407E43F
MPKKKSEQSTEPEAVGSDGVGELRPQSDPFADCTRLSDPRALRAYAHPTRMELVGLLRREGPLTATRAAELTGESVASCSYHLRMLAKYDLVENAEGGRGREKPWRATAQFTDWPECSDDPDVFEASTALNVALAENYFAKMTHALEQRAALPRAWQKAEQYGDVSLYLTADELTELGAHVSELLSPYAGRLQDPESRPADARLVSFLRVAFVRHVEVRSGSASRTEGGDPGGAGRATGGGAATVGSSPAHDSAVTEGPAPAKGGAS